MHQRIHTLGAETREFVVKSSAVFGDFSDFVPSVALTVCYRKPRWKVLILESTNPSFQFLCVNMTWCLPGCVLYVSCTFPMLSGRVHPGASLAFTSSFSFYVCVCVCQSGACICLISRKVVPFCDEIKCISRR